MFYLQLRNELWKLFGKKRTYIGFAMFLLAQNAIIILLRVTHRTQWITRELEMNGFDPKRYITVLTISTVMVTAMAFTLLPLYTALVGGDMVAKEAEDGTLRMILSRPISRLRLILLKWTAGGVFSVVLVFSLGMFGLLFTSFWYPWGDLFSVPGPLPFGTFDAAEGFRCYVMGHLCMVPKAFTVMTLAFMFSCFNMKPAAATILALSVMFISRVMQDMPFFLDYQSYFITYDMDIWREAFAHKIAWWKIGESFSLLAAYNLSFLIIGATVFQMRDVKS
ncbi:MAG TPA: ABC transporter permease subunit [Verrucomicrobiae bacterium]|nr:ABC transporter permease subunit [Verrucomicrobiae bacterium]